MTKKCSKCHKELDDSCFYKRAKAPTGLNGYCKACSQAFNKVWKKTKPKGWHSFYGAKARCNNANHPRYKDWGGRGIRFKFNSWQELIEHLGPCPDKTMSINRVNNNGHYEVGNVEWATATTQSRNCRTCKLTVEQRLLIKDLRLNKNMLLKDLSKQFGVTIARIHQIQKENI